MKDWTKADWVNPALNWSPKPVSDLPERATVDFAMKCNLRCAMCPVWGDDDEEAINGVKGIMDRALADKFVDELEPAKTLIHPGMYGEQLLIPNLKERFRYINDRGMALSINTNGLTLTENIAEFLVDIGLESIAFSIDAVTPDTYKIIRGVEKLEKVEAAVHRMLAARGDKSEPRIGVSFTKQEENCHEEEAFVEKWAHVVDFVRVGHVFVDGKFLDMPKPKGERQPCPALYSTLPVHNDGAVSICCLDGFKEVTVGNVFEDGVAAIWQGEAFAKVRYYHETGQIDKVPFCAKCDRWASYDFEEEQRDGLLIRKSMEYTYYNRIDRLGNWTENMNGGLHNELSPQVSQEQKTT